jgi:hypothetical protein
MNTTAVTTTAEAFEEPTFGEEIAELMPWIFGAVFVVPVTFFTAVLWAPFLLLFVLVAAPIAAVGALGTLAAILAMPFLFLRNRYRHFTSKEGRQ